MRKFMSTYFILMVILLHSAYCDPNCLTTTYAGKCVKCNDPFSIINGTCVLAFKNCKTYSDTGDYCLSCNTGSCLHPRYANCTPSNPLCKTSDVHCGCTSCNTGFSLYNPPCSITGVCFTTCVANGK